MKHSMFSRGFSSFRKGNKHHPHHRLHGSFSHDDENLEMKDHQLRKMGQYNHKLHGMGHGWRHKFGHGRFKHHDIHHKFGHGHGKLHKMKHCKRRFFDTPEQELEDSNESCEHDENLKETNSRYEPKSKAQVTKESNKFQICVDTSCYQPTEISVKVISGKIEVSAMHESIEEDVCEFHEMHRSFTMPSDVNPESLTSYLDSNGKLTVEAQIITKEDAPNVRDVPVIRLDKNSTI